MGMKKKAPERKCVGCGQMHEKRDMMRVIKTPEGEIMPDPTGKKNGRGAYLCYDRACLEKAVRHKGLERSLGSPVSAEVYERLGKEFDALADKQQG